MKFVKIALSIATLMATSTAFAGTLTTSSNLNILAFDGQKVKRNSTLQINDTAEHQVVVEVSSIYQSGSDNAFFESQPLILTFSGTNEDVHITAPNLKTSLDVSKFKKAPHFQIKTVSGKALTYKQDELKGEGFMPNANVVENLANYNAGNGVAALKSLAFTPISMPVATINGKVTKGKVLVQGENIVEQQLQYWFQQADKETQKRFLDWAKKR